MSTSQRLAVMEERAEAAAERHLMLADAFMNTRRVATFAPEAFTPRAIRRLHGDLIRIAQTHFDFEQRRLGDDLDMIASDALTDAKEHLGSQGARDATVALSEALTRATDDILDYARSEFRAQLERDVATVDRDYRTLALRAEMRKLAGTPEQAARMEVAADSMTDRSRLWFRDRLGRKLPAQKFVRRLWRQSLRDVYMASYVLAVHYSGRRDLTIYHPEPTHRFDGRATTTDEIIARRTPDYEDVFHPSARALPILADIYEELRG